MPTTYITRARLEALFSADEIARLATDTGANVESVIAAANAETDAYVSAAVALPPSTAAIALLEAPVADIVRYRLYRDAASDHTRQRFEDAIAFLRAIAAGKVALPIEQPVDDPDTPEDESQAGQPAFGAAPRLTRWHDLGGTSEDW